MPDTETVKLPPLTTLMPGDPFPWVRQRAAGLSSFATDAMAGRYLVFCFFGSLRDEPGKTAVHAVFQRRDLFDDDKASFFGVSVDPEDEAQHRVHHALPGIRILWDFDGSVSRQCGVVVDSANAGGNHYFRRWIIVDPSLHVLAVFPFESKTVEDILGFIGGLPKPDQFAGFEIPAPVLVLPNVFNSRMCEILVSLYEKTGGELSGINRSGAGVHDNNFKIRRDVTIDDQNLIIAIKHIFQRRVMPEIEKLFFMKAHWMERYIIGCYAAEDRAFFKPHRDNSSSATCHRRFAVSINLNADFLGGEVAFPEYNPRGIKAPPGWAVVFPAAILHKVSAVTEGRRYAFLPFVYDDTGAQLRRRNLQTQIVS